MSVERDFEIKRIHNESEDKVIETNKLLMEYEHLTKQLQGEVSDYKKLAETKDNNVNEFHLKLSLDFRCL